MLNMRKEGVVPVRAEGCVLYVCNQTLSIDKVFFSLPHYNTLKLSFESDVLDKGDESVSLSATNIALHFYRKLLELVTPLEKICLLSSFGKDIDRMQHQNIMVKCQIKSSYLSENVNGSASTYLKEDRLVLSVLSQSHPITYSLFLTKTVAQSILKFIIERQQNS